MAAQALNMNVRKYMLMCVEGGGGRWRVEKDRIMGCPNWERKTDKVNFHCGILRVQMWVRGGKNNKI